MADDCGRAEDYGRAIGRIEGKLDGLIAAGAEAERKQMQFYLSVEAIKNKHEKVSEKMEAVLLRLQKAEEPLAELARLRERLAGAAMLAGFAAAGLGGVMALFWQKLALSIKMWI